ncbi:glycosyl transferase family [Pyrenophora seminiperda CCB06]|uniref:Glycosyl transferase family n=1 Tax=Pyrenophora seminiperda CCB06 TaxID=1302712 RepID=A0A3M7M8G6_9PLEO|nr:glycosyl transferase family [Pyrenophora seminiperda CCB06]
MPPTTDQPSSDGPVVQEKRVWTTLITNTAYLTGLLTLDYSLKKTRHKISPHSPIHRFLPRRRIPENCAFTTQHPNPSTAQHTGPPCTAGLGMPNGGLQVVNPSTATYNLILEQLSKETSGDYDFADQSLLGDLFNGRWVAIPYIYNALKTLRSKGVHDAIWKDDKVKNVHYILSPKPWEETEGKCSSEIHEWWWVVDKERREMEKSKGIDDGF